jgi:hypothetical protein
MKSIKINFEMVNCALLFIILILVIICCTNKSEGFGGDEHGEFNNDIEKDEGDGGGGDDEESCSDKLYNCSNALESSIAEHDKYVKHCNKNKTAAIARCEHEKATIKQSHCGGRLPKQATDSDDPI